MVAYDYFTFIWLACCNLLYRMFVLCLREKQTHKQAFHLSRSIKSVKGIPVYLIVKSNLSLHGGFAALRQVNYIRKEGHKVSFSTLRWTHINWICRYLSFQKTEQHKIYLITKYSQSIHIQKATTTDTLLTWVQTEMDHSKNYETFFHNDIKIRKDQWILHKSLHNWVQGQQYQKCIRKY